MTTRTYSFQKAKPAGVKAEANACPTPSANGLSAPPSGALTGTMHKKANYISPKAAKRYSVKGVGRA